MTRAVLDDAAGRDGRVSTTEALRIRERADGGKHWSDDALRIIDDAGQQTMSRAKLERLLGTEMESALDAVAGNGRVSLAEGRQLPAHLRTNFAYLRGQLAPDPAPVDPTVYQTQVRNLAFAAIDAGTAVKLDMPPKVVRGRKPIFDHVPHPATNTALTGYVAGGQIYVTRSAHAPTPLVGWYRIGPAPA